jgi:hypothetical protein
VKDFFVHRTVLRLTLPFIITFCLLLAGTVPAGAANNARVQIGFVGAPPPNFQNVLLNVVSVRINPHIGAAPNATGWQKIPAPPGIGGSNSNAELQIDLNSSQNIPQLLNTSTVRTDNYKIVQLVLDTNNPGTLIPNCPASPTGDGCINYPIQLNNPNGITFSNPDKTPVISTSTKKLTSFVMQVAMTINKIPSAPGGAYTVTLTLTPVPSPSTGTITGQVTINTSSGTAPSGKVRKLQVAAETIGTNTVITTAPIQNAVSGTNCPPSPGGCFTLALPAAGPPSPATPFGTLYDLAVSGGAADYAAIRLPPLFPGGTINPAPSVTITGNRALGNITGTVRDACTAGKTIVGATLQVLIPPDALTKMKPPPPADFCITSPEQCISVATANTDNTGNFPLPGTVTTPSAFDNIPILPKSANPYVVEVTASGYEPLFVQAIPGNGTNKKGGGTCSIDGGVTFKTCNLAMMTGFITGSIPIVPPNSGQTALVQVFAEDHDSNNIESALPMPMTVGSNNSAVNFTLRVPPTVPFFDLFASTIDLYQGVVDPYQGHNIVAISHVPAPAACATMTAPTPIDPTQVITCVGHGSITGSVANPNLGESVVLEKADPDGPPMDNEVQITNSIVQNQPPNPNASSNYSFCAPADTYELQKFETFPTPEASAIPSAAPTASPVDPPVSVTIPLPPNAGSPTPTPAIKCPTNCSHPDGTCPGICNNVNQPL